MFFLLCRDFTRGTRGGITGKTARQRGLFFEWE